MNDSIYLLPYRLGELKPDSLKSLEKRITTATMPFQDLILFYLLFPYARYALIPFLILLVYALPILALILAPVTLIIGIPTMTTHILSGATTISSSPVHLAALLTGVYSLSLFAYIPTDKNDYTTKSTPTNPPAWEFMFHILMSGLYPLVYFLLHWHPDASLVLTATQQSPLVLAIISGILGHLIVRKWFQIRYTQGDGWSSQLATMHGSLMFIIPAWSLYLALIEFNIDILVFGPSAEPTITAFYALLAWSCFVLRRIRWTVYEDWAGYRTIHPFIPVWGIPRLPFMFALFAVLAGAPLTTPVIAGTVAPFVGGLAYMGWRLWITGDMMVHPNGSPGAGRKAYQRQKEQTNKKIMQISAARDAVNEFNEYATNHGIDRLPDEQALHNFDPDEVLDALEEIDRIQARKLSGDAFTDYAELRDEIRTKINKI